MPNLKYYFSIWNSKKGFEIILYDGDYITHRSGEDREIEGRIFGSLGGWKHSGRERQGFIKAQMYDEPSYSFKLDPTTVKSYTKEEVVKAAIKFIFEEFVADLA